MHATAGATCAGNDDGRPRARSYVAGKMAIDREPGARIFSLVVPPFTLFALWLGARKIAGLESGKVDRARAAGEPV